MEQIIFTKVPHSAKRYFRSKLGVIQRAVDFKAADHKIKAWAKTLSKKDDNGNNEITFKIVDGKKQLMQIKKQQVLASDAEDGLLGLLSRYSMKHNNSESLKALNRARELLVDVDDQTDGANEIEKNEEQDLDDEEVFSSLSVFDKGRTEVNETESEDESGALAAPAALEEGNNDSGNETVEADANEDFGIAEPLRDPLPEVELSEPEATPEPLEKPQVELDQTETDQNFAQVIQLGNYLDTTNSEAKLSKFSSKDFDVKPILNNVGYTEEPQDQFDKNLNKDLLELLDHYSLLDQQSSYEDARAAAYRDLSKKLADSYNELNHAAIKDEADQLCAQKLQELESYAAADQDQINTEVDTQEANYQREQKLARDNKVKDYEARLKDEDDAEFAVYSRKLREDSRQKKDLREHKLEKDLEAEKEQAAEQVINSRNKALADKKVDLLNETENQIIADYRQKRLEFQKEQADYRKSARAKAAAAAADRKKAADAAFEREMSIKTHQEEQRRNDLLARQVEQADEAQAKKAAADTESLRLIREMVAKMDQNNHKDRKTMLKMVERLRPISEPGSEEFQLEADDTKSSEDGDDLKRAAEDKDADQGKSKKMSKWIADASLFLAIVALLANGVAFGIGIEKKGQADTPVRDKKVEVVKKAKPVKSKAKPSKAKPTKKAKKTAAKRQAKKSNNNLDKYVACSTWAQKVDVLNGALGQHDDRTLKQINITAPTKISRLYESIVLNDQVLERKLWLKMTPPQRQQVSRSARNAITLAFYNVKDWEHGWETKQAIYG